jgi:hypothetical protein
VESTKGERGCQVWGNCLGTPRQLGYLVCFIVSVERERVLFAHRINGFLSTKSGFLTLEITETMPETMTGVRGVFKPIFCDLQLTFRSLAKISIVYMLIFIDSIVSVHRIYETRNYKGSASSSEQALKLGLCH